MPKKTKKEKIIAAYHRKLKFLQESRGVITPQIKETTTSASSINPKEYSHKNPATIQYFFSDLRKSLFLIAFIIALEIGFYFATIKGYLKLGK